mmetsp:Transcript_8758/g.21868  ORF Transcript_8758/g.21868 Transcript_8758/m.21868 type:complete len:215 (+) Transcript_8758:297-941(+)
MRAESSAGRAASLASEAAAILSTNDSYTTSSSTSGTVLALLLRARLGCGDTGASHSQKVKKGCSRACAAVMRSRQSQHMSRASRSCPQSHRPGTIWRSVGVSSSRSSAGPTSISSLRNSNPRMSQCAPSSSNSVWHASNSGWPPMAISAIMQPAAHTSAAGAGPVCEWGCACSCSTSPHKHWAIDLTCSSGGRYQSRGSGRPSERLTHAGGVPG